MNRQKLRFFRLFILTFLVDNNFSGSFGKEKTSNNSPSFVETIQLGRNEPEVSVQIMFKEDESDKPLKEANLDSAVFSILGKTNLSLPCTLGRSEVNFHLNDIKKIEILENFSTTHQQKEHELKTIAPNSQISFLKAKITTESGKESECFVRRDVSIAGYFQGTKGSIQNIDLANIKSITVTGRNEPDHIKRKRLLEETIQKITKEESLNNDFKDEYSVEKKNKAKTTTLKTTNQTHKDSNSAETKGLLPSAWRSYWNKATGTPSPDCEKK